MKYTFSEGDTLPKLLLKAASAWPKRVALREKDFGIWQEVTWKEYSEHVRDFGLGLRRLGLKRGDRVAIQAENKLEWVYADLGIQVMGGVTVGIYPTNPSAEVKHILADSESVMIVVDDQENVDKALEVKSDLPLLKYIICMNMKGIKQYGQSMILGFREVEELGRQVAQGNPGLFESLVAEGQSDDYSVLIYTSGTTGHPKGAIHSHRTCLVSAEQVVKIFDFYPNDRHLSYLPLCHAFERGFAVYQPLMIGYTVNFAESIDTVQADLREIGPTIFITVPRILEKIQGEIYVKVDNSTRLKQLFFKRGLETGRRLSKKSLLWQALSPYERLLNWLWGWLIFNPIKDFTGFKRARLVICAGAPSSEDIHLFFHGLGVPIREAFGMTELCCLVTVHRDHDIVVGTTGPAVPECQFRIAEDGEIQFKAPGLFLGYFRNPQATEAVYSEDGWFCTGDLGECDTKGHLKITGRKKDIIITSGGKNVSPQYIETKLKASPFIREALVVGDRRKYLAALIQIDMDVVGNWARGQGVPFSTIRDLSRSPKVYSLIASEVQQVNRELNRVEQIKRFSLIDKELYHEEGDMTATQKIKRSVLESKFADSIESLFADPEPREVG